MNEKLPCYDRGEFLAVQRLVKYLKNGPQRKHEVRGRGGRCDTM